MSGCDQSTFSTTPEACQTFVVDAEESRTFRNPSVAPKLSEKFWSLDLGARLPRVMSRDGTEATTGDLDRIRSFLRRDFPSLTEEGLGNALSPMIAKTKRWYLGAACDLIELRHRGATVGAIIGAPEDWSTYYVRIFAVSPSFQRPALTRRYARECLVEPLAAHGVQRIVAETSPANLAMSRGLTELHFHVTGHQLSERYGPLVRYTRFLDPAAEAAFLSRFAGSTPPCSNGVMKKRGGRAMKKKFALGTA
jgi:ribosomal protein S18 acetylase RimI-like enzyme